MASGVVRDNEEGRQAGQAHPLTRRQLLRLAAGAATLTLAPRLVASGKVLRPATAATLPYTGTAVSQWCGAALAAIPASLTPTFGPPMAARTLALVHTAIFDAWANYDATAVATASPTQRLASGDPTIDMANKVTAVSYAAYTALGTLFPSQQNTFASLLASLAPGGDATAMAVGTAAAQAVLLARQNDGAYQGSGYVAPFDAYPGGFADYPDLRAGCNTATTVIDPNQWQPLQVPNAKGAIITQRYLAPHWGAVTPFALSSGQQFRPAVGPQTTSAPFFSGAAPSPGYVAQAQSILTYSAALNDTTKVIAEYWKDGPNSVTPPGHWMLFGQYVALRDSHGIDDDVKMFFILSNALFDAGIAAWDAKRFYCSVRPVTAVRYLYSGAQIQAWGGPCAGMSSIDGAAWLPYQPLTLVTPAFPEFVSGHSCFSHAGATILRLFTGSDAFNGDDATYTAPYQYPFVAPLSSSAVESCTPTAAVTLRWATFSAAAAEAGLSRQLGGIHFDDGDQQGRLVGHSVGVTAWNKALSYITPGYTPISDPYVPVSSYSNIPNLPAAPGGDLATPEVGSGALLGGGLVALAATALLQRRADRS